MGLKKIKAKGFSSADKWVDIEPYGIRVDMDDVDEEGQRQVIKQLVSAFNSHDAACTLVELMLRQPPRRSIGASMAMDLHDLALEFNRLK